MVTIGTRVRSLRTSKNWSQEDLAKKSGLKRPHISLIENNERTPGADTLAKLVIALETNADYLLDISDDPNPRPIVNNPALTDPHLQFIVQNWADIPQLVQEKTREFLEVFLEEWRKKRGE